MGLLYRCPHCSLLSVAVGMCPECRVDLIQREISSMEAPSTVVSAGKPAIALYEGTAERCLEMAGTLRKGGVPVTVVPSPRPEASGKPSQLFVVAVPEADRGRADACLTQAWDELLRAQGEEIAREAEGLCPACGDPIVPGRAPCPSCGIALA